jgi:hypothetical protein
MRNKKLRAAFAWLAIAARVLFFEIPRDRYLRLKARFL